ncbi:MAG: hypothetical protein C0483_01225 [Pirellula sp.]|nr:hypothetical protein [Pirellula sp.]
MRPRVCCRRSSSFAFASLRLGANLFLLLATAIVIADEAAKTEPELNDSDREHWAYQTPKRAALPEVRDAAWCRTPVDRFILAALEGAKLQPAESAAPAVLLRRVTFDLTGLPPTPEEIAAFERSGDYEAVVDRLLASRAYAERWAQHWLDVARYADSDGYEHDIARPEAWRYRDWVIDALDRDLSIDDFLRLQLAGDELRPDEPQAAVATGFLLCGPDMPDLNRQDERRSMVLNEMTGTVGSALLGLQVGCAQCHDHKFEPISQADFYRLRACFETADFLSQARKEDDSEKDVTSEKWRVFRASKKVGEPSRLWVRGDFTRPGPTLDAGYPRVANLMNVSSTSSSSAAAANGDSTRRTRLAEWLTTPEHPLTPRVFVNRVWQEHFGFGLVRTSNDFGYLGDAPTHPELFDWLAREFVDTGWSLKKLHRLIVTSAVYRQSSTVAADSKADPENRLLAHYPRRRLDGEAIRDAMLAASDGLSDRRGGPGVMPPLPKELLGTIRKDHWKTSKDEEDHRRRSIYLFVRRNLRLPLLEAFDRPDTMASCTRRNRSTIAPQALVLLNSEFAQECAAALAKFVGSQTSQPEQQIKLAYVRTLGRAPTDRELVEANALVDADPAGLEDLCLALFNLNEFVYVD